MKAIIEVKIDVYNEEKFLDLKNSSPLHHPDTLEGTLETELIGLIESGFLQGVKIECKNVKIEDK